MRWLLAGLAGPLAVLFVLVSFETPAMGLLGFASLLAVSAGTALRRPRLLVGGVVAGVALVLTLGTLALDRTVESRAAMTDVGFGFPISFVSADLRWWSPPSFPSVMSWNPWEDPARFHQGRFLASYATVLAVTALAAGAAVVAVRRVR